MTAIISKAALSGATPEQARELAAGLASAPLRALAAALAADPALTVSVITYQDGTAELEVLHTGPPHRAPEATSPRQLPPARTLPLATPADLADAAAMIRALIRALIRAAAATA
jgi:hypothetical protein